jgi:stage II sporulation protein AA (anti-sigma F factor antagonist)
MAELRIDTERTPDEGQATGGGDPNEDRLTVRVAGEVDLDTADQLAAGLDACHGRVVVDLAGVTFIDSSGLGTLVRARNRLASEGGGLFVQDPSERVRRLFELTGLTELLSD